MEKKKRKISNNKPFIITYLLGGTRVDSRAEKITCISLTKWVQNTKNNYDTLPHTTGRIKKKDSLVLKKKNIYIT